jgi:hypothetical protein
MPMFAPRIGREQGFRVGNQHECWANYLAENAVGAVGAEADKRRDEARHSPPIVRWNPGNLPPGLKKN